MRVCFLFSLFLVSLLACIVYIVCTLDCLLLGASNMFSYFPIKKKKSYSLFISQLDIVLLIKKVRYCSTDKKIRYCSSLWTCKVFLNNNCSLLQNDPVIPAFPDLHLSPAAILKELAMYFQKFSTQTRLLTLPSPHELPPREAQEYPFIFSVLIIFL